MHFVSAQSQDETLSDITTFIKENLRDAVSNPDALSLKDFETKIQSYEGKEDYVGLLEYILTLKQELVTLPTTHKSN
jgi:hypothetical protein